jgi:hypothetical protein
MSDVKTENLWLMKGDFVGVDVMTSVDKRVVVG